ncbi:MAG: universal stress protein [Acidimicrobiales bacterium]
MGYSSVVVGTDGSTTAEQAVREAAEVAAADGARLVVVTAYVPGEARGPEVEADDVPADIRYTLTERVQAEELAEAGRTLARTAGVDKVVVQALEGDPADVLLTAAADFAADLIVVGSQGLTRHAHLILGSVAASVAHHAPCDVLVAHTSR